MAKKRRPVQPARSKADQGKAAAAAGSGGERAATRSVAAAAGSGGERAATRSVSVAAAAASRRAPRASTRITVARDGGAVAAAVCVAAVLAATSLAVDTAAAGSFDAPKRLAALLGAAVATALAFLWPSRSLPAARWRDVLGRGARRAAAILAAAALAASLLSALASPRHVIALDALRAEALLALFLLLGASRVGRFRGLLAGSFLAASAVNAGVAVLESRGLFQPFQLETFGSRQDTGAFAGNVGYLAITLAFASVVALAVVLEHPVRRTRILAGACLPLFAAALVVNQNLTALTALLVGAAVLLALRFRARAILPMVAAAVLVAGAVAAYPPLRARAGELGRAARAGDWDTVLSFRGGPWAAAIEMARERPLLGYGPGTFAGEYVPHRLAAEIRARRRFLTPLLTSSYAEAHSDYLQLFSDVGAPGALCAIGAAAALLFAIARRAARERLPEAVALTALLATGAAAALTWFPLQRPVTAVPLLLAAGRAWRVAGEGDHGAAPDDRDSDGESEADS